MTRRDNMLQIDQQLLGVYTPPNVTTSEFYTTGIGNVSKYLKSRQTITITQKEMEELVNNKNFWFYESDMKYYKEIESNDVQSDEDFTKVTSGYGISEYVAVHERYLPSMAYLKYAKENNKDIVTTVYDAHSACGISKRTDIMKEKISKQLPIKHHSEAYNKLPQFDFKIPKVVKYTQFIRKEYQCNVTVPCFWNRIHMLSTNIPYSYYAHQPLPVSTYNWDINKEEFVFGGYSTNEFLEILSDICTNGIQRPMFMRMNGEILSSVNDETTMILFIAKLLKLPSIPVTIYLSNDDISKNFMMDAMIHYANSASLYKSINFMNRVFDPYIIIYKPDDDSADGIFGTGSPYDYKKYPVFSSSDHLVVHYLDTSVESDDSELNEIREQLKDEAESILENDVKMIKEMISGENDAAEEA